MSTNEPFWERPEQVERFASRAPDHRLVALLDAEPEPARLRVLDLGCAGGRNTVLLAERGAEVTAVDASAAMVAETRRRLAALLASEDEARRRVHQGAMDDLSWAGDGSFDLVVALGVLHNAASGGEWERTLAGLARVLASGGRLLVSSFTPRTDLSGDGVHPVAGEPHVYDGLPGGRAYLLPAADLDREMARFGLLPAVPTQTVEVETDVGRRVSANALYRRA
jgi:SAM-dependent methyltransferase